MKYAKVIRRFFAYIIDLVVITGIYILLGAFFDVLYATGLIPMIGVYFYGSLFLSAWLYFAFLESSSKSASIGKQVLGLKIVCCEGKQISFLKATVRYVIFSFFPIGMIFIFFTKKQQALHDIITSLYIQQDSEVVEMIL